MAEFVKVASVNDIPQGSMKTVQVSGKAIALANVEGEFFAIADRCTHDECSLGSEGFLEGSVITCGCHGAQFEITTGEVIALPATQSEATYAVKVEGNDIFINL